MGSKTSEEEILPDVVKVSPKIFPEGPVLPYAGILKQTISPKINSKKKIIKSKYLMKERSIMNTYKNFIHV